MSMKSKLAMGLIFGMLVLTAGTAAAGNTLSVTTGAALTGTYGLAVSHDGSSANAAYVESDHPTNETTMNIEFQMKPNGLSFAAVKDLDMILLARGDAAGENQIKVFVRQGATALKLVVLVQDASPAHRSDGFTKLTAANINPAKTSNIRLEWKAESSAGAHDGYMRLYKQGSLIDEYTAVQDFGANIDKVYLGIPANVQANASGGYYFDNYVSTR